MPLLLFPCEVHVEALPVQCFFTSLVGIGWTAIRYFGSASKGRRRAKWRSSIPSNHFSPCALIETLKIKFTYTLHSKLFLILTNILYIIRLSYQTPFHTADRSQAAEWTVWRTCCCHSPGCSPQAWCQRWAAKTSWRWCLLWRWYELSCSDVSLRRQGKIFSLLSIPPHSWPHSRHMVTQTCRKYDVTQWQWWYIHTGGNQGVKKIQINIRWKNKGSTAQTWGKYSTYNHQKSLVSFCTNRVKSLWRRFRRLTFMLLF